jgi:Transglycosylase SLT domain
MAAYQDLAKAAAAKYGVPTSLFLAQIGQESAWNPSAVGPTTRYGTPVGLAQFMPGTAAQFHIDPYDPAQSLDAAAKYDAQLYQKTGSWTSALKSYGTLPGSGTYTSGQRTVADIASGLDAGGPTGGSTGGTPSGAGGPPMSGTSTPTSTSSGQSGGPSSGSSGGIISSIWEIILRGMTFFMGLSLVLVALFAALSQSKTVRTSAETIGKLALA